MQRRHTDRATYFTESAVTARSHYLPYIKQFKSITGRERILEIGCGEGGNLFPFAQLGCDVTGIDLSSSLVPLGKCLSADINRLVETGFVHIYPLFTYFPTYYIHVFFASLTKRKKQSTNSLTSSRAEHPSNCLKTGCASVAIASSTDNYGSSIRTTNKSSGYLLANCLHSFRTSDICETSSPHLAFIF